MKMKSLESFIGSLISFKEAADIASEEEAPSQIH